MVNARPQQNKFKFGARFEVSHSVRVQGVFVIMRGTESHRKIDVMESGKTKQRQASQPGCRRETTRSLRRLWSLAGRGPNNDKAATPSGTPERQTLKVLPLDL